jgi:hypothetical protein
MIEWLVLAILILFIVYAVFTLATYVALGINLVLLIALALLVNRDLKRKEMHRYYMISLLLTAVVFIFSDYGVFYALIEFMSNRLVLSVVTQAVLMVYAFAHLGIAVKTAAEELRKKLRKVLGDFG